MSDKKSKKSGGKAAAPKPDGGRAPSHERDQVDLFIEEVTEELQKERAYKLFRRYGPIVGGVVVAIVLAASVNEYLKSAATHAAREAGAALIVAGESQDAATAAEGFEAAAAKLEDGPALLARLHAGALRAEAGEKEAAAEAFERAAAMATDSPIYQDLAQIRATMARFEEIEPDAAIAALEPLSAEGRPFRPLALELLGMAELRAGRVGEARQRLEAAYAAWAASPAARLRGRDVVASRRRVSELLEGLGPESGGAAGGGDAPAENGGGAPGEGAATPNNG